MSQNCSFTCTHPAGRKENSARGGAPLEWLLSGSFALVAFSVLEAAGRYGVASFFFPFFPDVILLSPGLAQHCS